MDNLERAKLLLKGDVTLSLVKDKEELTSTKSGIAPMMEYLGNNVNLENFSAADRVVGKAVAMLFVKAKVKEVYAEIISIPAFNFLVEHGVRTGFGEMTEAIKNRSGDGLCPMEQTVLYESDVSRAYEKLKDKLNHLKNAKH